ncbi:hypothetical protein NEUTE1DRAFT_118744 [Neurospora tetrasperma FGSC 2508]|uniref:Uncharacterized protein n=1 Tax=Neurospora tetrasperma (strain FGSC 2508 / ATCC MYA-4615 / P0657) TaxID=510951 RepID=F8N1T7_NEUT8|nr:uncharacterized protein NEUTE1DRAFT_118744 [Neurospora tetrasperma FGSC 2508]EGO52364.1 hypothetical protein NEUTE1DRAFT_118744 [Neurospora tetrasperma FGSC 2508]
MMPLLARYCYTTTFREIGAEQCRHLLYGDYSYRHFAVHRANLLRVNAGGGGSDQGSSSIPTLYSVVPITVLQCSVIGV